MLTYLKRCSTLAWRHLHEGEDTMPKVHILMTGEIMDAITAAIERARKHPLPWEIGRKHSIATPTHTLTLEERSSPENFRPHRPECITLPPSNVRCCVSFEEQPAGIMRHLSISTHDGKGMLPLVMIGVVAKAFGIELPLTIPGEVWMEEYEPGCQALNICVLEVAREEGHA